METTSKLLLVAIFFSAIIGLVGKLVGYLWGAVFSAILIFVVYIAFCLTMILNIGLKSDDVR